MNKKIYQCVCGKELTTPNSFNGHKSACKTYLASVGKLDAYIKRIELLREKQTNYQKSIKSQKIKQDELELKQWIEEQHTCERCGKTMTSKYGSGRFCSVQCSNARTHSKETVDRISTGVSNSEKFKAHQNHIREQKEKDAANYYNDPNFCCICNSILPFDIRHNQTCGKTECYNKLLSILRTEYIEENGYNLNVTVKNRYKYGTYQGISCDSSWELAFVMYNIDHEIQFKRNRTDYFEYMYEGRLHKFYPDFILDDGTYIEIKGRKSDETEAKVSQIPSGVSFKLLYEEDLDEYFTYVREKYGVEYYRLYDKDAPSWMDHELS